MIPGAPAIQWRGLVPPPVLKLSRIVEPVRYTSSGERIEAVTETVSFERVSILDGCHSYRELFLEEKSRFGS